VLAPLVLLVLILMAVYPLCYFDKTPWKVVWQKMWRKLALSFFLSLLIFSFMQKEINFSLSAWAAIFVICSALATRKNLPAMSLAHTGFAIFVLGILLSSSFSQERDVRMKPGDRVKVGPYEFMFIDTQGVMGANYRSIRASFEVTKDERHIVNLYPEKRIYTVRDMVMTTAAIHPSLFRDLYLALGEPLDGEDWSVRIYYKPFIRWIWGGAILMMLGGALTFIQQYKKNKYV